MPSTSYQRKSGHKWTSFQERILLCLIARDIHVTGSPGLNDFARKVPSKRSHGGWKGGHKIHKDFAYAFNTALNGEGLLGGKDVDHREITRMAEMVLRDRVSATMMMNRKPGAQRLTRTIKRAWDRNLNFSGSKEEWCHEGRGRAVLTDNYASQFRTSKSAWSIVRDRDGDWVARDPARIAKKRNIEEACTEPTEPIVQAMDTDSDHDEGSLQEEDDELMFAVNFVDAAVDRGGEQCDIDTAKSTVVAAGEEALAEDIEAEDAEAAVTSREEEHSIASDADTSAADMNGAAMPLEPAMSALDVAEEDWENTTMVDDNSEVDEEVTTLLGPEDIGDLSDEYTPMEIIVSTPVDIQIESMTEAV